MLLDESCFSTVGNFLFAHSLVGLFSVHTLHPFSLVDFVVVVVVLGDDGGGGGGGSD